MQVELFLTTLSLIATIVAYDDEGPGPYGYGGPGGPGGFGGPGGSRPGSRPGSGGMGPGGMGPGSMGPGSMGRGGMGPGNMGRGGMGPGGMGPGGMGPGGMGPGGMGPGGMGPGGMGPGRMELGGMGPGRMGPGGMGRGGMGPGRMGPSSDDDDGEGGPGGFNMGPRGGRPGMGGPGMGGPGMRRPGPDIGDGMDDLNLGPGPGMGGGPRGRPERSMSRESDPDDDDDDPMSGQAHNWHTLVSCRQKYQVKYVTGSDTGHRRDLKEIKSGNIKPKGKYEATYDCLYKGEKLNPARRRLRCYSSSGWKVQIDGNVAYCVKKNGDPIDTGVEEFNPSNPEDTEGGRELLQFRRPRSRARSHAPGGDDGADEEDIGEEVGGRRSRGVDEHGKPCSVMLQNTPMECVTGFISASYFCLDSYSD